MMDTRGVRWGLMCCLLLLAAPSAHALDAIGSVEHVEAAAFGTPPGALRRDLASENPIHRDEMVETMRASEVSIVFVDGTRLALRENSSVVLDELIFDPNGPDTLLLDLRTGLFQLVSGDIDKEGVAINAGAATIGIRGTNIEIEVAADGTTTLGVREGVAVMTPTAGGAAVEVAAGQTGIARPGATSISVSEGLPDFMQASLPSTTATGDGSDSQSAGLGGTGSAQADAGGSSGGGSGSGSGGTGDGNGTGGAGNGNGNGNGNGQGDANGNAGGGNSGNGNGQGNGGGGNGNGGGRGNGNGR